MLCTASSLSIARDRPMVLHQNRTSCDLCLMFLHGAGRSAESFPPLEDDQYGHFLHVSTHLQRYACPQMLQHARAECGCRAQQPTELSSVTTSCMRLQPACWQSPLHCERVRNCMASPGQQGSWQLMFSSSPLPNLLFNWEQCDERYASSGEVSTY